MKHKFVLIFILLLIIPQAFALIPPTATVGSANIDCDGNVSIPVKTALLTTWTLNIDGVPNNSGNTSTEFVATGSVVPQDNHDFMLELTIDGFVYTRFANTKGCDENIPRIVCNDGRMNPVCDIVAIYPIEDDEGIHMQVWYVLPDGGKSGQFAFMLYADELAALPNNIHEPFLVSSSSDDYVKLYWMPDSTYLIIAGPDSEGKLRFFTFETFPGSVEAYTIEA